MTMYAFNQNQFAMGKSQPVTALAEILGAFSYALDLTEGQPAGHSIRACWIGTQLGQAIGLDAKALRDLFYAVLLKDLGCSSNSARVAELFVGDDRKLKHDFKLIGPSAEDFGAFIVAEAGAQAATDTRAEAVANLLENAGEIMTGLIDTRCTRGADIARQLRFSDEVADIIAHLDEHWDGSGLPSGTQGAAIPLGARIALMAQVADVFFMNNGIDAARAEIARRSGSWFDPGLANLFMTITAEPDFWAALGAPDIEQQLFALEPAQHHVIVDEDFLDDIATAFGQVIDAKSPYTGGHSERVGLFADLIAQQLGLSESARRPLRRAAMLHDVGKLGVSSQVLEKPGKLDADEWQTMQSHAGHTTSILSRIGVMADMAIIAGSHHERLDGKGYPLQIPAWGISLETRIISVADFFDALTADRPYRSAMSVEDALAVMAAEVGTAIDARCFEALKTVVARGVPEKPLPDIPAQFS
jgi:HD-GYP domain-containing protein (c-di-GMP phosphodiesterase class II)